MASAPTSSQRETRDQALAWFVRLNSGDATEADQAALQVWLRADARHRLEYERLAGIWQDLDALPDPRRARATMPGQPSRRRLLAGSAGAIAAGALVVMPFTGVPTALAADYRTGTGERRTVIAPDGTTIELDAATAIAEDYTPDVRRLRLIEGRALFTLAHDAARTFEVTCRDGAIQSSNGTFVVHRRADDVLVSVASEGVTVVAGASGPAARLVPVAAGQRIAYTALGTSPVEPVAGDGDTAWRRGKLIFRDRPLGEVIADLNRYRQGRIVIGNASLAQLRIDGIFDAVRPDAALEAVIGTFPVKAYRLTDWLVVLWPTAG